jgi:hypothetical protein
MKAKGQPRFDIDALRDLAGQTSFARGQSGGPTARGRAVESLEAKLAGEDRAQRSGRVELLICIHIQQKKFAEAWATASAHRPSIRIREELARASEATHPREALQVYAEQVEHLASISGYAEAAKLIARMAKLRSAAEQSTYVAALRERHGRKRNFMKLLG